MGVAMDLGTRQYRSRFWPGSELLSSRVVAPGFEAAGADDYFAAVGAGDATLRFGLQASASLAGAVLSVGSGPLLSVSVVGGDLVVTAGAASAGSGQASVSVSGVAVARLWLVSVVLRAAAGSVAVYVDGRLRGRSVASGGFPGGVWTDGVGLAYGVANA